MKKTIAATAIAALALVGCSSPKEADVVSRNLSREADRFEVNRRIVFYNGITDSYMLTIEGRCSLGNADDPGELTVTCDTGDGYKKHFLGLSDNVTYFVEQLESKDVSEDHYLVVFRPSTIVPDIEID